MKKKTKVLIAIPTRGKIDVRNILWRDTLQFDKAEVFTSYSAGRWLSNARNQLWDVALRNNYDEVFFIGDDIFGHPNMYKILHERISKERYMIACLPYLTPNKRKTPYESDNGYHWNIGKDEEGVKPVINTGWHDLDFCSYDCSLWDVKECMKHLKYPIFPYEVQWDEDTKFFKRQEGLFVSVNMSHPVYHIYETTLGWWSYEF